MKRLYTIEQVYDFLKNYDRSGSETDIPEGSRYIRISDTLANKLADSIHKHMLAVSRIKRV